MPRPFLIFSQSDYLIRIVAIHSDTYWQTVQIQISWLLKKPTDLDLHCLERQGISGFRRTRVNSLSPADTMLCACLVTFVLKLNQQQQQQKQQYLLPIMYLKITRGVVNSVYSDQMPQDAVSDLGLHSLLRPVRPNTKHSTLKLLKERRSPKGIFFFFKSSLQ